MKKLSGIFGGALLGVAVAGCAPDFDFGSSVLVEKKETPFSSQSVWFDCKKQTLTTREEGYAPTPYGPFPVSRVTVNALESHEDLKKYTALCRRAHGPSPDKN
ncbi:MAG: hypothetical protein H6862_04480 [Rhodospirillales bacterium]|nr:hypothetical protein [Rhodospirillales bacterium]